MTDLSSRTLQSLAVLIVLSIPIVVTSPVAWAEGPQGRTLSMDDRVAAQKAIEQVYWNHRIWPKENPGPKPPLSAVMPDEAIRVKVEDYLKQSNALETWWQRPITAGQLQAELDRMARRTRDGVTLQELYRALGNDPFVIAETLARQTLVDRLIHSWYSMDSRFNGDLKAKAESALAACANIDCMKSMGGEYNETTSKLRAANSDPSADITSAHELLLDDDEWASQIKRLGGLLGTNSRVLPLGRLSRLEETPEAFVVTCVRSQRANELSTASVVWPKRSFDAWWSTERSQMSAEIAPNVGTFTLPAQSSDVCMNDTWADTVDEPEARGGHTAVWTGSEMIVWGGNNLNSGGRYNPATDSWTVTSQGAGVPSARASHTAIWTGTEMIVWGGGIGSSGTNSGGRYNPSTDTWAPTSQGANVPSPRIAHAAVWTGTRMIVWGGSGNPQYLNSGGRYDPSTDTWTPTSTGPNVPAPRIPSAVVWSGTELILWAGFNGIYVESGGRYNPATDSWATMTPAEPTLEFQPDGPAIWTGVEMIVWPARQGGVGGRYNPSTDSWSSTSTGANSLGYRTAHTLVWTGTEMIVWGGTAGGSNTNTGGRYKPSTDTWLPTSTGANVPVGRNGHTAVWTGTEMIVWGGVGQSNLSSGGRYNPSADSWIPTHVQPNVPTARSGNTAVWTGAEMIVWGGSAATSSSSYLNSGDRYNPSTDSWTPTSMGANVPTARNGHTAVWTGTEMIIWGGGSSGYLNSGGRYNPTTNSWLATNSDTNVPSARQSHTALWTGTQMIIWGGTNGSTFNSGSRYDPSTDSWAPTSQGANVPLGRTSHTAVWTGTEMIVWGGTRAGFYLNTGGRYNPTSDSWVPTSIAGDTPAGRQQHTAVWTGTEMVVWGGSGSTGFNSGGRYNPSTDGWAATSTGTNVPLARQFHTATWTGAEMIVWGGTNLGASVTNTGGRYAPTSDGWVPTSTGANVPSQRSGHTAVWTGSQMIIWGGGTNASNPGVYCACPNGLIAYRDADGDGYGAAAVSIPACDGSIPAGYVADGTDCNDGNGSVHPGATETCNGLDDDCNLVVDDGGGSALCNDANVCTDDACNAGAGCSHAFNTAPCDDGMLCTNADTCSAGVCAGVVGPPPEIRFVGASGHGTTTLNWTGLGGGTLYDLTASTLSDMRTNQTSGATCLANDVSGTSYMDTQPNPVPSEGYYYLIRAQNVCGSGGYGFDSTGAERIPASACP